MKRLFRVSFDILITSIVPIVSWFLLGIILDSHLINVFSLTYPLQCLMGIIIAIFGVGANISVYKDENKYAADNGIFYGTFFSVLIFGVIMFNCCSSFLSSKCCCDGSFITAWGIDEIGQKSAKTPYFQGF